MDRYNISKGSEEVKDESVEQRADFSEYIEETRTLICFDATKALWYIRVKCGEKDWANVTVQKQQSGYWSAETITFKNRVEAENWCKEKGLI